MKYNKMIEQMYKVLQAKKNRSAWNKGVQMYAEELMDDLQMIIDYDPDALSNANMLRKALLNGADSWSQYSWGGCSLIYNDEIAERLCTASELKRTHNGERRPNASEEWLDTQARALFQASNRIVKAWYAVQTI